MKLSLMRFAHRAPVVRALAKRLPPVCFFRCAGVGVTLSLALYPHRRRSITPLYRLLAADRGHREAWRLGRDFALYRNWLNQMEHAWPNWAERYNRRTQIAGENYLQEALNRGKGAILLSGHYLGFSRYVAPLLAQRGYRILRAGTGRDPVKRESRWGAFYARPWEYVNYHGDLWQRSRALNRIRQVLEENGIVHVSIRWLARGDPACEFSVYSARFFVDPTLFKIFAGFGAPQIPCLALCDSAGDLSLTLEPPLSPGPERSIEEFKRHYRAWLQAKPEFMREWKRIGNEADGRFPAGSQAQVPVA